jgi:hypothetical protein
MFRGVWVLLGAGWSDGCAGFFGGVIVVSARGIEFSTVVEGIPVRVLCSPVWVRCSTYVGLG